MDAVIPAGATVRIACGTGGSATEGDVVAFLLGGALTVHRLVHRGRSPRAAGWFIAEGDNNLTCDAPVRVTAILGVVREVRRDDGAWQAPGAAPRARLVTRVVRLVLCAALELHPRLAAWMKGMVVHAMTPHARSLYGPDARPSASVAHTLRS